MSSIGWEQGPDGWQAGDEGRAFNTALQDANKTPGLGMLPAFELADIVDLAETYPNAFRAWLGAGGRQISLRAGLAREPVL